MSNAGHVALLGEALDRFIALSQCGLQACDGSDPDALAGVLEARELVTHQLRDLMARLNQARPTRDAWRTVSARARDAERLNRELEERAVMLRDTVRQQLDRLNHEDAALGAYASATPRVGQLDLRR